MDQHCNIGLSRRFCRNACLCSRRDDKRTNARTMAHPICCELCRHSRADRHTQSFVIARGEACRHHHGRVAGGNADSLATIDRARENYSQSHPIYSCSRARPATTCISLLLYISNILVEHLPEDHSKKFQTWTCYPRGS